MEQNNEVSKEMRNILRETETENFLFILQSHLIKNSTENQRRNNRKYSLTFYRNLPFLDRKLGVLTAHEKKLLKVKINSSITYLDNVNRISSPSPFVIGVFTAILSLVLGVMIKDPASFPKWTLGLVIGCFVLFIPGISWFTLEQSGKHAELKEILSILKEILD